MRVEQMEGSQIVKNLMADIAQRQQLMHRIVGHTHELVAQAMQANWLSVLDGMETRRQLLQTVFDHCAGRSYPEVTALSAAVTESERALTGVIAHAIVGQRYANAEYALYR